MPMFRIKHIAVWLLATAIMVTGVPVMAKQECPMTQMEHSSAQSMEKHDCDGCEKTETQQSGESTSSCCDEMDCSAQCQPVSGSAYVLPSVNGSSANLLPWGARFSFGRDDFASLLLNTQDRPPKTLS
ncbi:MAG: hypothetical protein KDK34_19540 [Leptospiraceae bacterium]|nr:hypothetical protein [Leptospiraceae bacterium]